METNGTWLSEGEGSGHFEISYMLNGKKIKINAMGQEIEINWSTFRLYLMLYSAK